MVALTLSGKAFIPSWTLLSVFMQASAAYLQERSPVPAGFGWVFFLILWGSSFAFTMMRTLLGGCYAADLCKSSKVQLFHLPFKRDDQSS